MVGSKPLLIPIIFVIAIAAGGAVWLFVQAGHCRQGAAASAASSSPSDDDRKRTERFFGGKTDYDLTGGQEMKPRW